MRSQEHEQHIKDFVSHARCSECRADTERRFVDRGVWNYQHVHAYLSWIRGPLKAIRAGANSGEVRAWQRKFMAALHRRINLKMAVRCKGRKWNDSYLERMGQFPRKTDAGYLRQFASRGASCLDY